jgi:hypothetical protein
MKSYENDHPNYSSLEEAFSRNEPRNRSTQIETAERVLKLTILWLKTEAHQVSGNA